MNQQLARLKELGVRRDALLRELERSLAIQSLWPEAFAAGPATSQWIGAPLRRAPNDSAMLYALRLRVSSGAESREFPQDQVPAVLWPHSEKGRLP